MSISLQKANFWKRISAFLCDIILVSILAVGFATLMSAIFGYTKHFDQLESYQLQYTEQYGIKTIISNEEYENLPQEEKDKYISNDAYEQLPQEEKDKYTAADEAFSKDKNVIKTIHKLFYLTFAIVSVSLFFSYLIIYFIIPLFFKNGQTLGKKVFGLAVMRSNCVKVSNPVLFVRAILGQYTIEAMVPALLIIMILFGVLGFAGTLTLILLAILEIVVICITKTRSSIHDLLSDTVVVDYASQQIFDSQEALIEYKQQQHAEEVAKPEGISNDEEISDDSTRNK